jgi:O-methyltransferase
MLSAITSFQMVSIILVLAILILGFKVMEMNWSYRISKPYQWETADKKGEISSKLKRIERFYRDKVRFYFFWFQIQRLKRDNIAGAFAEVGVYKGETARMIHEMDPSRSLHLFDTFEGFDKQDLEFEIVHEENRAIDFSDTNVELVSRLFGGSDKILFHKGYFPQTAEHLKTEQYAFVHLDADLYKPTLAALHYFYPRLSPGGVIIVHDYNHTWKGIGKAIAEFVKGIPESAVEIPDWQGSLIIVRTQYRIGSANVATII